MTQVTNIPYDALSVGQQASFEKQVQERDVQLFAAVSGDNNPVHLDAAFAAETMFKERIAHGMFTGALISAEWLPRVCAGRCASRAPITVARPSVPHGMITMPARKIAPPIMRTI